MLANTDDEMEMRLIQFTVYHTPPFVCTVSLAIYGNVFFIDGDAELKAQGILSQTESIDYCYFVGGALDRHVI